jgi:hypothetical protein
MASLLHKSIAYLLAPVLLATICGVSQAQHSLRAGMNVRPPTVVPTRSSGDNSLRFNHASFSHPHVFNRHAALTPFHNGRSFRNFQHEGFENLRRLALGSSLLNGGYFPGYSTPYTGGYLNPGYSMPPYGGGYSMMPSSGYPTSGYGAQPSYSGYDGASQTPLYYGADASLSVPSYPGTATSAGAGQTYSAKQDEYASMIKDARQMGKILTAVGVPNDAGQLSYPLGLQVLQPQIENMQLLDQIETLFQLLAVQQATGPVNANLVQEAKVDIDRLQTMLKGRQYNMMPNVYSDAQQYLEKLRHGLEVLQPKAASSS